MAKHRRKHRKRRGRDKRPAGLIISGLRVSAELIIWLFRDY